MTLLQFYTVLAFVTTCILVTFSSSRKINSVRKQRDRVSAALLALYNQVKCNHPAGIDVQDSSMKEAKAALLDVVRREKYKNFLKADLDI